MSERVKHPSLAHAILAVMAEVGYVQKTKPENSDLKYLYASERALISALRPSMIAHGLVVLPVGAEMLAGEEMITTKGAKMNRLVGRFTYRLKHADSGESETLSTLGEAADTMDKTSSKAMTAAYKYMLRQTFIIETGNDPDKHASQPTRAKAEPPLPPPSASGPRITPEQGTRIDFIYNKLQLNHEAFRQKMHARYGTDDITQLSQDQAADMLRRMEAAYLKAAKASAPAQGNGQAPAPSKEARQFEIDIYALDAKLVQEGAIKTMDLVNAMVDAGRVEKLPPVLSAWPDNKLEIGRDLAHNLATKFRQALEDHKAALATSSGRT